MVSANADAPPTGGSLMWGWFSFFTGKNHNKRALPDNEHHHSERNVVARKLVHEDTPAGAAGGMNMMSFYSNYFTPTIPDDFCGLCLESCSNNQDVGVLTGCGHVFHQHCHEVWQKFEPSGPQYRQCAVCNVPETTFCAIQLKNSSNQVNNATTLSCPTLGAVLRQQVQVLQTLSHNATLVTKTLDDLCEFCYREPRCRVPLLLADLLPALLQIMRDHGSYGLIQKAACQLLGHLGQADAGSTERIEIAILRSGGLQAVLSCMQQHVTDKDIQELACFALGKLMCEDDDNEIRIPPPRGGGSHSSSITSAAPAAASGSALPEAATADDDVILRPASVSPPTAPMLTDKSTLYALEQQQMQALLQAMRTHPEANLLQTYACYAVSNLLARNSHDAMVQLLLLGGRSNHDTTTMAAANDATNNDNSDGLYVIVCTLKRHLQDVDVVDAALSVLASLAETDNAVIGARLVSAAIDRHGTSLNAGQQVLQAMRAHADLEIHEKGLSFLLNVLRHFNADQNATWPRQLAGDWQGIAIITRSMLDHAHEHELQRGALEVLARLAQTPAVRPLLQSSKLVEALQAARSTFQQADAQLGQAATALLELCHVTKLSASRSSSTSCPPVNGTSSLKPAPS